MVAKYAEKRAALKKIVNTGDPVEAFEAAQKVPQDSEECKSYSFAQPL